MVRGRVQVRAVISELWLTLHGRSAARPNNDVYEGEFANNKFHGMGVKECAADGTVQAGRWENDELVAALGSEDPQYIDLLRGTLRLFSGFCGAPLPPRPASFTVLLLVTCPVPPHAGIGGNLIQYFEFLDEDFSFRASLNPKKGADDSYAPK